jgi:Arc/MetJ family transcription regulator
MKCEHADMRTTIVIDDELLARAQLLSGAPTKRATVEYALRELVGRSERRKVLELRGRVEWEGDLLRPVVLGNTRRSLRGGTRRQEFGVREEAQGSREGSS